MAAPREVPIILGIFIALATVMTHTVAGRLDVSSPRPSGPRVTVLARSARIPSVSDLVAMVSVGALGLVAIAAQVRSRRARLLEVQAGTVPLSGDGPHASATSRSHGLPPSERRTLAWRTGLVLVEWACFAALSFAFMLRRPPQEWRHFLMPCALLLLPARVHVRYREGESLWAPWLLALSVLVLGVTGEPRCTWGLLVIAGVCQFCVLRQEHARRGMRGTSSQA